MYIFNTQHFATLMFSKFSIVVDKEQIGEESVVMYKEELDNNLVSDKLLKVTPAIVMLHTYIFNTVESEWIVCVASNADTNYPLFLVCLKDGKKVHEEVLSSRGEEI